MADDAGASQRVVVVTSTGRVSGEPDVLDLHLGVSITADSAQGALRQAGTAANDLLAVLGEHGVTGRDVATEALSVHPNFTGAPRPDGYLATNGVRARLRDLSRAGALVDAVVLHVGEGVALHGVRFGIADPSPLLAEARRLAVQQALLEAAELAAAAGVQLGPVRSIETGSAPGGPARSFVRSKAAAMDATPVEAGEHEVSVTVTVVVDLL